jgi:hypothetical protein
VIGYLGRYSHKVAISNHRIKNVTPTSTTITYKDYKDGAKHKEMTLTNEEFLRRFCQHILPARFTKIRHFGLHSGACTKVMDELYLSFTQKVRPPFHRASALLLAKEKSNYQPQLCPCCSKNTMVTILDWQTGKPPPTCLIINVLN